MTKREIVYTVLRERANEWVNGNDLVAAGAGYRFGARIDELRKAGHNIARAKGGSAVHDYMLVIEDVAPGQIPLPYAGGEGQTPTWRNELTVEWRP